MEDLELTPISSMFEEQEEVEVQEEVQPSIFDDVDEKEVETKVETEEVEESTEEVDLTSVKTLYNHWKEFLPFDEVEEPTVEFLREQQEKLPEKFFMSYVETRPDFIQDLLAYQSKLQNPSVEDVKGFFDKYLDNTTQEVDVSTTEGAREFLKAQPEFAKMYKTEAKINQALDILEDEDELIERAKEIKEEKDAQKVEAKKLALQQAEADKQARLAQEKEFASKLTATIDSLQWKPERKQKVVKELDNKNISTKWAKINQNTKALVQFADFFSYFDGESFDAFYNLIEGKEQSKEINKIKGIIEKDSLGKLLGKHASHESKNVRSLAEDFG